MAFIINGIAALVTAKFIWPEVRPGEGVSGMRGGPPPPPPPKEGELHCLYNQQDSSFVTAKFIWPEIRPGEGFPAGGAGLPPRPLRRRGSYRAFIINDLSFDLGVVSG